MPFDWFGFRKPSLQNTKPPALQTRVGPLEVIALPPSEAWDLWQRERSCFGETGLWPLFLGPDYVETGRQDPEGSFEDLLQEAKRDRYQDVAGTEISGSFNGIRANKI